jgi:hypothetical protein
MVTPVMPQEEDLQINALDEPDPDVDAGLSPVPDDDAGDGAAEAPRADVPAAVYGRDAKVEGSCGADSAGL